MAFFEIPIKGLKSGRSHFDFHAGKEFFDSFGGDRINDADIAIAVDVVNVDMQISLTGKISGNVTVSCDRCLDDLVIPVETQFESEEPEALDQDIYDFVCLSLPTQCVHPLDQCNPEVIKYLNVES